MIEGLFDAHGEWKEDMKDIVNAVTSYSSFIFLSQGSCGLNDVLDCIPHSVSEAINNSLLAPYTLKEAYYCNVWYENSQEQMTFIASGFWQMMFPLLMILSGVPLMRSLSMKLS